MSACENCTCILIILCVGTLKAKSALYACVCGLQRFLSELSQVTPVEFWTHKALPYFWIAKST